MKYNQKLSDKNFHSKSNSAKLFAFSCNDNISQLSYIKVTLEEDLQIGEIQIIVQKTDLLV